MRKKVICEKKNFHNVRKSFSAQKKNSQWEKKAFTTGRKNFATGKSWQYELMVLIYNITSLQT